MHKKWLVILSLIIVILTGLGFWLAKRSPFPPGFLAAELTLTAGELKLYSPFPGRLNNFKVKAGEEVKAGQELAEIDDLELKTRYEKISQQLLEVESKMGGKPVTETPPDPEKVKTIKEKIAQARIPVKQMEEESKLLRKAEREEKERVSRLKLDFDRLKRDKNSPPEAVAEAEQAVKTAQEEQKAARKNKTQEDRERHRQLVEAKKVLNKAEYELKSLLRPELYPPRESLVEVKNAAGKSWLVPPAVQKLRTGEVTDDTELESQYRQLIATKKFLEKQMGSLVVKAPSAGQILEIIAQPGEEVNQETLLLTMLTPDKPEGKAFLPESKAKKIKAGMEARIYLEGFSGQDFSARVKELKKGEIKNQAQVVLKFDKPDDRLKAGQRGKVIIRLDPEANWNKVPPKIFELL